MNLPKIFSVSSSNRLLKPSLSVLLLQFGNFGAFGHYGSSSSKMWSLDNYLMHLVPTSSQSSVDLISKPSENDVKMWPSRYVYIFVWVRQAVFATTLVKHQCHTIFWWYLFAALNYGFIFLSVQAS